MASPSHRTKPSTVVRTCRPCAWVGCASPTTPISADHPCGPTASETSGRASRSRTCATPRPAASGPYTGETATSGFTATNLSSRHRTSATSSPRSTGIRRASSGVERRRGQPDVGWASTGSQLWAHRREDLRLWPVGRCWRSESPASGLRAQKPTSAGLAPGTGTRTATRRRSCASTTRQRPLRGVRPRYGTPRSRSGGTFQGARREARRHQGLADTADRTGFEPGCARDHHVHRHARRLADLPQRVAREPPHAVLGHREDLSVGGSSTYAGIVAASMFQA